MINLSMVTVGLTRVRLQHGRLRHAGVLPGELAIVTSVLSATEFKVNYRNEVCHNSCWDYETLPDPVPELQDYSIEEAKALIAGAVSYLKEDSNAE